MSHATRPVHEPAAASPKQTLIRLLRLHDAKLTALRRSLRDELPATGGDVKDEVEVSLDELARSLDAALLETSAATVRAIERALGRLEAGTYGACLECGRRIGNERLKILPFAERCRNCQHKCDRMPVVRAENGIGEHAARGLGL